LAEEKVGAALRCVRAGGKRRADIWLESLTLSVPRPRRMIRTQRRCVPLGFLVNSSLIAITRKQKLNNALRDEEERLFNPKPILLVLVSWPAKKVIRQ